MKSYKIGIDIGGNKIRGVLVANKTADLFTARTPKTKKEFVETLKILFRQFQEFAVRRKGRIDGVGIGAAGVISRKKMVWSPNISYLKNFDFKKAFPQFPGLKVDNDARTFLMGQRAFDGNWTKKKVLLFTLGTGVGRAYAETGAVQRIKKFEYPEIWEKEYQTMRDARTDSDLVKFLAKKLSLIVEKFEPQVVLIGGGIVNRKNFFPKIKKELKEKSPGTVVKKASRRLAGALGAAFLIKNA